MASFGPTAGYIFLIANGVVLLGIGYFARKTQLNDASDYEVAGRRTAWPLISGSLVVTLTWASALLVSAEAGYRFGWSVVWIYPLSALGAVLMVPFWSKIKRAMPSGTTFPEYIRLRYGKSMHLLTLIITLTVQLIILFYLIIGMGSGLSPLFGIPYWQAVVFGGIIVTAYTLLGGLWSSLLTDYFQYLILWVVIFVAFLFSVNAVGSLGTVYDLLMQQDQSIGAAVIAPDAFYQYFLVYLFGWIVYPVMDQMIWQRMYAIKDPNNLGKSFVVGYFTWAFLPAMGTLIGIIALATNVQANTTSQILAAAINAFAPSWLIILFAIIIFNSIASTYGSMLVAISSVLTTDIYDAYIGNIDQSAKLRYNQIIIAIVGVTVSLLGVLFQQSILELGIYQAAFYTNLTWPIFLGFLWPRIDRKSMFAAVGIGFVISLTLGTAVNYDYVTQIGSIPVSPWVVYAGMLIIEVLILFIGTALSEEKPMSIEDVGRRSQDEQTITESSSTSDREGGIGND